MHTLKGSWAVQTFALAKSNESDGRKSRIRRSKEERKSMVESFIKKYQNSNNGSFPSLNLTHKEVGGSFYTVREIVREVIQENRVLGPAKFSPEELSYQQDEQDPLGSIAVEPSTPLYLRSNRSHFVPNHHEATSEESVPVSAGLCSENENQRSDNEHIINGYQVDVTIEESGTQTSEDLQTSEQSELEKNSAASTVNVTSITEDIVVETFPLSPVPKIIDGLDTRAGVRNITEPFEENETERVNLEQGNDSASLGQINSLENSNSVPIEKSGKQTSEDLQTGEQLETEKNSAAAAANMTFITEDIVVETFPLRPVPNIVDGLDTRSGARNLTEPFEENETEKVNLEQGNGSASLGQINASANSNLVGEKNTESHTAVVLDINSDLVDKEVAENIADPQLKSSNNFIAEGGSLNDTHVDTDVEIEVLNNDVLTSEIKEQSQKVDGSKAVNASNGKNPNSTYASNSRGQVRTPEGIVTENEVNVQGEGNSHKGSNPTLDRINLESWEGASRKSAETETNPILAIFKSFITALIKFWSE